jgi:hypothetical protein
VGEIKIVLLSNLPVEEVLKVAGSMEPAPTGPPPPMPPVPPDGEGGGGGGGGGSAP